MTKLDELATAGQSVWYDFIRRDMIEDGALADLVASGVRGLTSNPSIFEQAIARSDLYDRQIAGLGAAPPEAVFDALAIADISAAADVLRPVYDATNGTDGFVSLEVSPRLAHDTAGTIDDAVRLWRAVDRPNLMIKVPATDAGIPAIEELIASGINVNATLMFSLSDYERVANAFIDGAERRQNPAGVASVASFFVSRVDSAFDAALTDVGTPDALALRGTIAVANAKAAYRRYQELFEGGRFAQLAARGASAQRVLWASTSTKNPDYRDVMYVEELIGPNTVNTAPPATIEAFEEHGEVIPDSLVAGVDDAVAAISSLAELGIDYDAVTAKLQVDGVAAFADAYESLLGAIADKQAAVRS
jgi:transaldolase